MMSYFTRLQRNRKGFTLIELMVVVVILGILAGAAVMTLGGGQADKAERSRAASDINTFVSALEFYKLDVKSYPTTLQGLNALVTKPASGADGWAGPYMKSIPVDPNGTAYAYESPGAASEPYTISSTVNDAAGNAITDKNLAATN